MNPNITKPDVIIAPSTETIKEAYVSARGASDDAVFKAFICGQMLNERQNAIQTTKPRHSKYEISHNETNSVDWDGFLTSECPEINRSTAYRYMDLAFRIVAGLELPHTIGSLPLSRILTTNDAELLRIADSLQDGQSAQAVKDTLKAFLAGKTMREALDEIVNGGDDPHHITRAINGAKKGGSNGEDRKDWIYFSARKFHDLDSHLGHWDAMTEDAKNELKTVTVAAMRGDEVKLAGRKVDRVHFEHGWPKEYIQFIVAAGQTILKGEKP